MLPRIKKTILGMVLIIIAIGAVIFINNKYSDGQRKNTTAEKTIEDVLKEHSEAWMSRPEVVGTAKGLCDDQPCIKIYVKRKAPGLRQKIPNSIENYPIVIQETGEFRALPKDQD